MAFPAFLDTCALYGSYLCDTLLSLAEAETYRPLWSTEILDELKRNLLKRGISSSAVAHRITEMRRAFPDAEVTGYEPLIDSMTNEPKDRHVLTAAVRSNAAIIYQKVRKALSAFDDFPIQTSDYLTAAEFSNKCRREGVQGSHTDFLICAVAHNNCWQIFTADNDFLSYAKHLPITLFNT